MCGKILCILFWMATVYRVVELAVSDADQNIIVAEHNKVRSEIDNPTATNMQKMYWSDDLAAGAQEWVDKCIFGHNSYDDRDKGWGVSIGQNAAQSTNPDATPEWARMVQLWASERVNFTYGVDNGKKRGHLTQIVTANTPLVGCGFKSCPNNKQNYVCDYAIGQSNQETPYAEGDSCSACTDKCADKLCDCGKKLFNCKHGGTTNLNTCTCDCTSDWTGDDCNTFNDCDKTDHQACTDDAYKDNCKIYSNWGPDYCPHFCGLCK